MEAFAAVVEDTLGIAVADHKCPIFGSHFSSKGISMIGFEGPWNIVLVTSNLDILVHLGTTVKDHNPYRLGLAHNFRTSRMTFDSKTGY